MVIEEDRAYCQPCLSPVWDTALRRMRCSRSAAKRPSGCRPARMAAPVQDHDVVGDWASARPNVRPGGWAFQYANPHYPDVDDTAVVVMALDPLQPAESTGSIDRGAEWILGLQSRNGGWGAFDADNEYYYLNHIPFADHGALLDPPTADVGALPRHAGAARLQARRPAGDGRRRLPHPRSAGWQLVRPLGLELCLRHLVGALRAERRRAHDHPTIRKAVQWLESKHADGGWGESGDSYWDDKPRGEGPVSTPSQTAWAVMGLMAAGEVDLRGDSAASVHLIDAGRSRAVGRGRVHRGRLPARFLSALSRLPRVLSALGARALSEPEAATPPTCSACDGGIYLRHAPAACRHRPATRGADLRSMALTIPRAAMRRCASLRCATRQGIRPHASRGAREPSGACATASDARVRQRRAMIAAVRPSRHHQLRHCRGARSALKPGDLVIARAATGPTACVRRVASKWLAHLTTHLTAVASPAATQSPRPRRKAMLHRDTGAACVDQESLGGRCGAATPAVHRRARDRGPARQPRRRCWWG